MPGRFIAILCLFASSFIPHPSSFAQDLPTFDDFARVDRERREGGRLQTAELMTLMRVDPKLLARVAAENPHDPELLWGLAELHGDWAAALEANGTNTAVALRFACASAIKRDDKTALRWFRYCQSNDVSNVVPWLGELLVLRQEGKTLDAFRPSARATEYRDGVVPAARARVRVLEKAGYTPYAARRIALMQNTFVESMAQDLGRSTIAPETAPFLVNAAKAMEWRPTFLLTELVGETLERAALTAIPSTNRQETEWRIQDLDERRQDLRQLVSNTEHNAVETATERQMVNYFDNVLSIGEEAALKRLSDSGRDKPTRH